MEMSCVHSLLVSKRCSGRRKLGVSGGSGVAEEKRRAVCLAGVVGRAGGLGAGPSGEAISGRKEDSSGSCCEEELGSCGRTGALSMKATFRITRLLLPEKLWFAKGSCVSSPVIF